MSQTDTLLNEMEDLKRGPVKRAQDDPVKTLFYISDLIVNVEDWGRACYMAPTTLKNKIKKLYPDANFKLKDYVETNRLIRIKEFISENPEAKAIDIAFFAKFRDRGGLQRFIRRVTGVTFIQFKENPKKYVYLNLYGHKNET